MEFKAGRAVLTVELSARDGAPVKLNPDDVSVVATRPAGDLRDITCKVEVPRDGVVRALCDDLPFGHWEFMVNIDTDEGPVKIVERTYVKKKSH